MIFFKSYMHDVHIAVESILTNKLRSALTALGIIFGVAAVISMMAIGNGAQQEILEQIKMVGVNNIIITPMLVQNEDEAGEASSADDAKRKKYSPGLNMTDVEAIHKMISSVKILSPEVSFTTDVIHSGVREQAKVIGVSKEFFQLYDLPLFQGNIFDEYQEENGLAVCVIGANIRSRFFSQIDPVGQYIKFGSVWLKIIGVLERNNITLTGHNQSGVNVINDNVYIPVKTMLMRFRNRALITTRRSTETNYHQLDRIVVQVHESEQINSTVDVLSRMIMRRHSDVKDFEITVPELLLKQQQRTKEIFNIVLGAIAGISLLVGGIGIMNIMFASVMERIKEIGTRMAIGAKKTDIVVQFLSEAVLISVTGGLIGVILGMLASWLITKIAGILTIVSLMSVVVSFFVSATIGIIFGYSPAKRASEKDPIESLRYE